MPIYEYACQDCQTKFERIRTMKDADSALNCGECESDNVKRLISRFNAASGGRTIASGRGCGSCAGGSCSSCGSN